MPNYVKNIIEFDCDESRFMEIANILKGSCEEVGNVDFNVLIPMPASLDIESSSRGDRAYELYCNFEREAINDPEHREELEIKYKDDCGEDCWEIGRIYYNNVKLYGCRSWYEWCNKNWNTKWNAFDCTVPPAGTKLEFETAWSGVVEIVRLISVMFPDVHITYKFADEDLGFNFDEIDMLHGVMVGMLDFPEGSKKAYEFSAMIWGIDLEADGYALQDDGSYVYMG